jgi:hypothetical protein
VDLPICPLILHADYSYRRFGEADPGKTGISIGHTG